MNVTILGAGNIGLGFVQRLYYEDSIAITVFSSKNIFENGNLIIKDIENDRVAEINNITVTNDARKSLEDADLILCTYPAFLRKEFLRKYQNYIKSGAMLGFIPGYGGIELYCKNLIKRGVIIFGMQRVPFVARTYLKENGQYESNILSLKKELFIAAIPYLYSKKVASLMEGLLHIKTRIVKEYLSITLTPSNPVLHITGLYNVFKNYKKGMYYKNELKFYEEWNDEASEVLFRYDKEVQEICNALNPIDLTEVVSLPLYYESEKPSDLTKKLKSIQAFKAVKVPLKKLDGNKYIPDFNSRMFIEDYPYGICIFKDIALMENVNTPVIDMLLKFYENLTGKQYFKNDNSYGKDINETGVFSITGIKNTDDLLSFYK